MGLSLGLLSTARINGAVLGGASQTDAIDVVAVASRDRDRAEAYAAEHAIAHAHGSYDALLADASVEAVYVPLPNSLHVEWTLRAIAAGKHVLCEKPLTRRPQEVDEVFDAAERAGVVVMEGFMYRHHPQTKRLKELVDGGAIGELRVVRASFGFMLANDTDVRLRPELDGGSLMDVGCYCVSAARLLAGEPVSVRAEQVVGDAGVDVRMAGVLRFAGDVLAHFDCGFDVARTAGLEVVGTEGAAVVRSPWLCDEPAIELRRGDSPERIEVEDANRFRLELENFAAAIRGDEPPLLGRDDALGQARTIGALYRSAENRGAATPVQ